MRSAYEKKSVRSVECVRSTARTKSSWGFAVCSLNRFSIAVCAIVILYYNGKKLNENGPVGLKFNGIEISRIFDILLKLHSYDFQIFS